MRTLRTRTAAYTALLALLLVACTGNGPGAETTTPEEPPTSQTAGSTTTQEPTDRSGGEATWGLLGEIAVLDPFPTSVETFALRSVLFESLIGLDEDRNVLGVLASDVHVSPDNAELTLTIREGVSFHDGTTLDAAAASWTLEQVIAGELPALGGDVMATASLETIDEMTLRLSFPGPTPQAVDILQAIPIVSPVAGTDGGVGTGPFVVDRFAPGDSLRVVRNQEYWGTPPLLDAVVLRTIPDIASMVAALETNDVDFFAPLPTAEAVRLEGSEAVEIETRPADGNQHILVNTTRGCLTDSRVRLALSLAFDRQRYIDTQLFGLATPVSQVFPPSSPAFSEQVNSEVTFDLERARALIDEAGCDVQIDIQGPPDRAEFLAFMPAYVEALAEVGVTATISELDRPTWLENFFDGNFDLILHSNSGGDLDPAFFFQRVYHQPEGNNVGFNDPQYGAMLAQAQAETNPEARIALYVEIARFIQQESFVIPIANQATPVGRSVRLQDAPLLPVAPLRVDFRNAWIDE